MHSASGQDEANSVFWLVTRAGKMGPYCPLGIAHFVVVVLLQNIFRCSKKIFRDFSVEVKLENEKTESVNENENKETKHHFCI